MSYLKSVIDNISDGLAPIRRDLNDISVQILGTKTSLLKIDSTEINNYGDKEYSLKGEIIENAIIDYPENTMEIFQFINNGSVDNSAINIWELLPIQMTILFEGDFDEKIVRIKKDDLLVDLKKDANENLIPIILQVIRKQGQFFYKNLTKIIYDLSLQRGKLESSIQDVIDDYVEENKST